MNGWLMKLAQVAVGVGTMWLFIHDGWPKDGVEAFGVFFGGFLAAALFTGVVVQVQNWLVRRAARRVSRQKAL